MYPTMNRITSASTVKRPRMVAADMRKSCALCGVVLPNQPIGPAHPAQLIAPALSTHVHLALSTRACPTLTPGESCWPTPSVQAGHQSSQRGPNRPQTPTILRDSVIFVVRSAILIKHRLFFSVLISYFAILLLRCSTILATVLSHFFYSAPSFSLHCSTTFMNLVIPRYYSAHPFQVLQCSIIFVVMLGHFSELSHSSWYSAQSFFIELIAQPFFLQ
jgi:hypothetical protein